jgi:uncharacterized protein YjiS (DUF1127 family)
MTTVSVNSAARTGILARFADMMIRAKAAYTRYRIFRTTLAEMQELSDRELADLGLSRSMLRRSAYEAAYG